MILVPIDYGYGNDEQLIIKNGNARIADKSMINTLSNFIIYLYVIYLQKRKCSTSILETVTYNIFRLCYK